MVSHSDKGFLMPLSTNNFSNGKDVFFTEAYKTMVRSEKELLVRLTTERPIVSQSELRAYRHDFYRLLRVYGYAPHLHWTIAYLNGIENPSADCSGLQSIRVIDEAHLSDRIARSNTARA